MLMIIKMLFTVLVVAAINLISKRFPALGGYMAVLPVITFLSLVTLSIDKQSNEHVSTFLTGALSGVALTVLVLLLMLFMVRGGLPVTYVVLLGISTWAIIAVMGTQLFTP